MTQWAGKGTACISAAWNNRRSQTTKKGWKNIMRKTGKKLLTMILTSAMAFSVPAVCTGMPQVSAAENEAVPKEDQKQMKKLSNAFLNSIGCELCYEMKEKETKEFDFSKAADRKRIGAKVLFEDGADADTTSRRVFGVKTKGLKLQPGDWGTAWPELKKIKIEQGKDGLYEIRAKVVWVDFEENTVTPLGTVTVQAEEKEGAYFGFVARSMKITK